MYNISQKMRNNIERLQKVALYVLLGRIGDKDCLVNLTHFIHYIHIGMNVKVNMNDFTYAFQNDIKPALGVKFWFKK